MAREKTLAITTAPFDHHGQRTERIMRDVAIALVPVLGAAIYFFGIGALFLVLASSLGALGMEWIFGERQGLGTLRDYTALLTGAMLGLTLPPALPLWMAFLGGAIAIGLGKLIWGGMGKNLFNPALVGRAFLQAAFPTAMTARTSFSVPGEGFLSVSGSLFAAPLMHGEVDVVSAATPLAASKFDEVLADYANLLIGNTTGSVGETAGILIVVVGIWLAVRKVFDWRLPVATLLSAAVFGGIFWGLHLAEVPLPAGRSYPDPLWTVSSGGLLFASVFMVTDPVTTPVTPKGMWIFGIGVGALTVVIRLFSGLVEGVMFATLLMNAITPLIDKKLQPRRFGGER